MPEDTKQYHLDCQEKQSELKRLKHKEREWELERKELKEELMLMKIRVKTLEKAIEAKEAYMKLHGMVKKDPWKHGMKQDGMKQDGMKQDGMKQDGMKQEPSQHSDDGMMMQKDENLKDQKIQKDGIPKQKDEKVKDQKPIGQDAHHENEDLEQQKIAQTSLQTSSRIIQDSYEKELEMKNNQIKELKKRLQYSFNEEGMKPLHLGLNSHQRNANADDFETLHSKFKQQQLEILQYKTELKRIHDETKLPLNQQIRKYQDKISFLNLELQQCKKEQSKLIEEMQLILRNR